jgi:hypothetical protein
MNSRRTPEGIRGRQLTDQDTDLCRHARTSCAPATLPRPEQTKPAPVPPDDGAGLDDVHGRAPAAPCVRQRRPEDAVGGRKARTWTRSVENGELVSERDDVPTKTSIHSSPVGDRFWKARSIQLRRSTPLFEGRTVAERVWRDERRGRAAIRAGTRTFGRGWSGGVSFVPVMKAADLRDRHDAALAVRSDRARNRRVLVE